MALMIDSVTPAAIPKGTPVVAGYVDGPYGPDDPYHSGWEPGSWNDFPGSELVTITVDGRANTRVFDIETGDGTPEQGAVWALHEWQAGRRPTLYANLSTWENGLDAALASVGLKRGVEVDGWLADYNDEATVPAGYVAHQYLQDQPGVQGSYIDYSVTNGVWPAAAPAPAPKPPAPVTSKESDNMLTKNTSTVNGGGYWGVRANGDVYTFDGAQYIGPLPKYLAQWGIGTAANPVVGIAADGQGGFALLADNGGPQPEIYNIPADGQFAH